MSRNIKTKLFISTVESVLLYGNETWTITKLMKSQLNGCYIKMIYKLSWKDFMNNKSLYKMLSPISTKTQQRRMPHAGHCCRHENKVVLWTLTHGNMNRGRRKKIYIDNLIGLNGINDINTMIMNREQWKVCILTGERPKKTT